MCKVFDNRIKNLRFVSTYTKDGLCHLIVCVNEKEIDFKSSHFLLEYWLRAVKKLDPTSVIPRNLDTLADMWRHLTLNQTRPGHVGLIRRGPGLV